MIGRAAWGNPWIFRQINAYLEMGIEIPGPSRRERMDMAVYHLRALADMKGEWAAVREMRAMRAVIFTDFPVQQRSAEGL